MISPEDKAPIVALFARKERTTERPMLCRLTEAELEDGQRILRKPIFDTWEDAHNCAVQLELRGDNRQRPYRCNRSHRKNGHYHLSYRGASERWMKKCVAR